MNNAKITSVGFIGLGIMGKPMVLNLLKAGIDVYFFARKKSVIKEVTSKGATYVPSVTEIPKNTKIIFTNLPNTNIVKSIILSKKGLINDLEDGSCIIDMSTISPAGASEIAKTIEKRKSFFIDAPVSGGEAGAISGKLSIMVGGREKIFKKIEPLLKILGDKITYIGPNGAGQVCKACNQILVAETILAVSEIINLAYKSKIDPSIIRKALLGGYANSKILEIHGERMIKTSYKPGFKLSLHHKDLKIAKEFSKKLGVNLRGLNMVKKVMDTALEEGMADLDSSTIHRILEKTYK